MALVDLRLERRHAPPLARARVAVPFARRWPCWIRVVEQAVDLGEDHDDLARRSPGFDRPRGRPSPRGSSSSRRRPGCSSSGTANGQLRRGVVGDVEEVELEELHPGEARGGELHAQIRRPSRASCARRLHRSTATSRPSSVSSATPSSLVTSTWRWSGATSMRPTRADGHAAELDRRADVEALHRLVEVRSRSARPRFCRLRRAEPRPRSPSASDDARRRRRARASSGWSGAPSRHSSVRAVEEGDARAGRRSSSRSSRGSPRAMMLLVVLVEHDAALGDREDALRARG